MEIASSSGLYRCAAQEGDCVEMKGETIDIFKLIHGAYVEQKRRGSEHSETLVGSAEEAEL